MEKTRWEQEREFIKKMKSTRESTTVAGVTVRHPKGLTSLYRETMEQLRSNAADASKCEDIIQQAEKKGANSLVLRTAVNTGVWKK
mmetsp:Transcript_6242/g.12480  ORF Transcript_6242/g.12480 Transcript_6242/m.12480 type:complete len:86 (+) Transcript_6242:96-353(+)